MNASIHRPERRRFLGSTLALGAVGLLGACGGGGDAGPAAALSSAPSTPSAPGTSASLSTLDAATYMVGVTFELPGGVERTNLIGTAWAVGGNLLVTNAHVVDAIISDARSLAQQNRVVKRVSVFQSETGVEVPVFKAANHPGWSRDARGPDVGLLEARTALPAALTLESPEGTTRLRKGDTLQLNGFPGDVFDRVNRGGFTPGSNVPRASLFTGTIQSIEHFNPTVVVDPANISLVDMYQHSMDTSGGTSGSPILHNGKVVAIHNSGVQLFVAAITANGQLAPERIPLGTGSWGVNVKHVHNLINFYRQGVLEADKNFAMPPTPQQLAPRTPGQAASAGGASQSFRGSVAGTPNPGAAHRLQISVDANLRVSGASQWPAQSGVPSPLPARSFVLSGQSNAAGRFEFRDNTPEVVPGFRRGVYLGFYNSASGQIVGEYYELNESTNELIYFGDWSSSR